MYRKILFWFMFFPIACMLMPIGMLRWFFDLLDDKLYYITRMFEKWCFYED